MLNLLCYLLSRWAAASSQRLRSAKWFLLKRAGKFKRLESWSLPRTFRLRPSYPQTLLSLNNGQSIAFRWVLYRIQKWSKTSSPTKGCTWVNRSSMPNCQTNAKNLVCQRVTGFLTSKFAMIPEESVTSAQAITWTSSVTSIRGHASMLPEALK